MTSESQETQDTFQWVLRDSGLETAGRPALPQLTSSSDKIARALLQLSRACLEEMLTQVMISQNKARMMQIQEVTN